MRKSNWPIAGFSMLAVIGAFALFSPQAVWAAEETMEEVVVTGSYIRRDDSFDTANPIDVLNSAELDETGTPNLGEVFRQQSFNFGVDAVTNILAAIPNTGTYTQANIRGLGAGATLQLINGRRTANTNVQSLYPMIALDRVETLTDGGAALYGTDAVAGVVNMIPRRRMEGVEVRVQYNSAEDWDEKTYSVMGGTVSGDSAMSAALQWRERSELRMFDRTDFVRSAVSSSGEGNPGSFLVPYRDPTGAYLETRELPDPGCGLNNDGYGTSRKEQENNFRTGFLFTPVPAVFQAAQPCRREFGEDHQYISPQEIFSGVTFFEHDFNDLVSVDAELLFSRQETFHRSSASNPGGRVQSLPVIRGEHPGNPYRAMTATGQLLYAQDSDADGIADRGTADANGDGVPDVILAASPFDPASGIPFNEDVRIAQWRVVSKLSQPSRNNQETLDGPGDFTIIVDHYRWAGGLEVVIPDTSWVGDLSYSYDKFTLGEPQQMQDSLSALQDGLEGELTTVINGETVDRYFNPFSTQVFECVNRDCSGAVPQSNPEATNPVEVLDQIATTEAITQTYTLQVMDLIFAGDVLDMPAGPLRAAVGAQWRDVIFDFDEGTINNQRDSWIQFQATDWRESRTVYAGFAELEIPVFDTNMLGRLDLNIAGRSEQGDDDSNADLDNTDYKVGLRWELRPTVAIRASAGTAFIAPSLEDLFAGGSFGLSNISDPLFGRPATFKARSLSGNPNLKSEEADVYNLGFTVLMLEDSLAISADWKVFFFEDRISRPIPQDVIFDDEDRFNDALAGGLVADATEWALNNPNLGTNTNPAIGEDPRIHRNPANLLITFVETPLQNVSSMVWRGADLDISYTFTQIPFLGDGYGQFTTGLSATYVDSFTYKQFPDQPSKEAAGNRNNATGFVWPMPRWQGVVKFGWMRDRHSVALRGRYKHHVKEDDTLCNLPGFILTGIKSFVGEARGSDPNKGCAEKMKTLVEWDLQYRFDLDGLIGDRAARVEVGAINLFDTFPIPSASLGGMETFLYDPRGRQWYVRVQTEI